MILNSPIPQIAYQVPKQFPAIYRENGQQMILLVQSFYEFLATQDDQAHYNARRMFEANDIDTTFTKLLLRYRNKYLSDLPFDEDNIRFIIKHITDFYRRKGSKEGIELFFKMFYNEEVDIYYPSEAMLKPSWSKWHQGKFLQLHPTTSLEVFNGSIGQRIYGSVSTAEAFIDSIQFIDVFNVTIPLIFLSDVHGEFVPNDTIFSLNPRVTYGRVYGSLVDVENYNRAYSTSGHSVGDAVTITGEKGYGAKGIITQVTTAISGQILFEILDGNYGYRVFDANTSTGANLTLSNQNVMFDNANLVFIVGEEVEQYQANANVTITATVVGQDATRAGFLLANSSLIFNDTDDISTTGRSTNITITPTDVTVFNDTAEAYVTAVSNTETVSLIMDEIEPFANVALDANNYVGAGNTYFSGSNNGAIIIDANTPLYIAFEPETFNIGKISVLGDIAPGIDYGNDIFVAAQDTLISNYDKRNQVIKYAIANTTVGFVTGDIITQTRDWVDFNGNTVSVEVTGEIVRKVGDLLWVKNLTFHTFVDDETFSRQDSVEDVAIVHISRDESSQPMGWNAEIDGPADFELGRIVSIKVTESGVAYQQGRTVEIKSLSSNNDVDAVGTAVLGQGRTAGEWRTKYSHIGYDDGKVLQDSDYYQDFSYEVQTSLDDDIYLETLKNLAHPAGTKVFTKFSLFGVINNPITIASDIEVANTANT